MGTNRVPTCPGSHLFNKGNEETAVEPELLVLSGAHMLCLHWVCQTLMLPELRPQGSTRLTSKPQLSNNGSLPPSWSGNVLSGFLADCFLPKFYVLLFVFPFLPNPFSGESELWA